MVAPDLSGIFCAGSAQLNRTIVTCDGTLATTATLAAFLLARQPRRRARSSVAYAITPPDSAIDSILRSFSGVWSGAVVFQPTAEMCVALIVENIRPNGEVETRFV